MTRRVAGLSVSGAGIAAIAALLAGCAEQAPPPPVEAPPPACDLAIDKLAGVDLVLTNRGDKVGEWIDDPSVRARFVDRDGKLKVLYNGKSPTSVFTYTCVDAPQGKNCWEDNPNPADYCKALIANKGVEACTVDAVAQLTGLSAAQVTGPVETTLKEISQLDEGTMKALRAAYDNPNNQLRGLLHVSVNSKECKLVIADNYEAMAGGQRRERENLVGTARFVPTKDKLLFEHCLNSKDMVALTDPAAWAAPGESKPLWKVGELVPFRYVGPDDLKPTEGCTYTQDTWSDGHAVDTAKAVSVDDQGRLNWSTSQTFTKKGVHVAALTRYKTCQSGATEQISFTCQAVRVE